MKTMICFENISYSQFNNEVITEVNKYVESNNDELCVLTLDQSYPFTNINTAIFHPSEMDSFNNGLIVSSTIKTAQMSLSCSNNSKKLLFLYDLDWMFYPMMYDELYEVLNNKNLILVSRSKDHIKPIKNLRGKEPEAVIENFNLEEIWNLL